MNRKTRKINRLIKAKFEGRISKQEEAELERLLASSQDAAEHQRQLNELEENLDQLDQTEMPVDISKSVMQKINAATQYSDHKEQKPVFKMRRLGSISYRYAAVLLLGLLLGAAVSWVWLAGSRQANTHQLTASMMNASEGLYYMQAGISIKVIPYIVEDLYYINFFIDADDEIEIETTFDAQVYLPVKMEYITSRGRRKTDNLDESISFLANGMTRYQIILKRKTDRTSSVNIKVTQDQNMLTSKHIF